MKRFENLQQKPDLSHETLIMLNGIIVQAFETLDYYKHESLESFAQQGKEVPGAEMVDVGYGEIVIKNLTGTLLTKPLDNQDHLSPKGLKDYQKLYGALGREVVTH
jgi:hypothetical protein